MNHSPSEESDTTNQVPAPGKGDQVAPSPGEKKVSHRLMGRHLMFRLNKNRLRFWPKPYVILSSIEGPIWVFFGAGQLWLTHRRVRRINEWLLRIPRFRSPKLMKLIDRLEPDLVEFIEYCESQDIIGALFIERELIEFHWSLRKRECQDKGDRKNREVIIDPQFNRLAQRFAELQLVQPAAV